MRKGEWKKIFAWVVVFVFVLTTAPVSSSTTAEIADCVYINGNIYTVEEDQPCAAALAVKGQQMIYVGSNKKAMDYIGNNTKVIDLKGKTLIIDLMEGHIVTGLAQIKKQTDQDEKRKVKLTMNKKKLALFRRV